MSQHDFTIANQTASSARSDINSGLQALASNSSGSSAPSTPYANMWWYNSSTNVLYIRNESNNAWIKVADIDQGSSIFQPANAVPVGAVNTFAMSTPPTGWLSCDGSEVSRTTYSNLFSVVGTTHGAGNGSTTFKLPDLRGEFVRGWDGNRGVDSGRTFGSAQTWAIENIVGTFTDIRVRLNTIFSATGAFTGSTGATSGDNGNGGAATVNFDFDASRVVNTASETRPRNVALLYCIKY
jgi:microcystin-dependent protein